MKIKTLRAPKITNPRRGSLIWRICHRWDRALPIHPGVWPYHSECTRIRGDKGFEKITSYFFHPFNQRILTNRQSDSSCLSEKVVVEYTTQRVVLYLLYTADGCFYKKRKEYSLVERYYKVIGKLCSKQCYKFIFIVFLRGAK